MKPNPGGILTGEAIVNRDEEIETIWKALENQSVVLSSERRVGKTCLLRKMEENPQNGWTPILYWVEGKYHPIEFVEGLYEMVLTKGMIEDKFHKLKKLYNKYAGGKEIASWKFPDLKENWKPLLESIIEDLIDANKKVLLMFDELPLMISHFSKIKDSGPKISMEFLDTLRELRNKYEATKKVAFVFCGSIGIHLVIKNLKRNFAYNADPLNNMKPIKLNSMNERGAKLLCNKLSEDQNYEFDNKDEIFDYICQKTDNLPFYIQHIFEYILESKKIKINKEFIDKGIDYLLNDPMDEGFFRHYTDRIKTYYDKDIQKIALFILDKLCRKEDDWKEDDIINEVLTNMEIDKETIRETITLLWNDHYFTRIRKDDIRSYQFKYLILKNWWKVNRG
jgi:hypothetical protein